MHPADRECQAALAAIQSVQGTLMVARALVDNGRRIDLAGLDGDVASLCGAILCIAPDRARVLRAELVALLQQLDQLSGSLRPQGRSGEHPEGPPARGSA
jgi:hypothetical protein